MGLGSKGEWIYYKLQTKLKMTLLVPLYDVSNGTDIGASLYYRCGSFPTGFTGDFNRNKWILSVDSRDVYVDAMPELEGWAAP